MANFIETEIVEEPGEMCDECGGYVDPGLKIELWEAFGHNVYLCKSCGDHERAENI